MAQNHDILVLKRGDALGPRIHENLLKKGYATQLVNEHVEALQTIRELKNPILIVDCGDDPERAYTHVKELIEAQALHSFPTIIVGSEVDGYEGVLGRYFKLIATLVIPCTTSDLLEAIAFISKSVDNIRTPGVAAKAVIAKEAVESPILPVDEESETIASDEVHELYSQWDEIPTLLFEQFDRYQLFGRELGGARYTFTVNEKELEELGLLPAQPQFLDQVQKTGTEIGKWGRGHLYRVAYLTSKLLEPLGYAQNIVEHAKNASLVYCCSFTSKDKELLRNDYYGPRYVLLRKDLCSKVKDSAMRVAVELTNPTVGNIIATVGRLIGREENAEDTESSMIASTIVTADYIDRICFNRGSWNPHAAYSLMRRLKAGRIKELHPTSLACAIKLLSEAISASPNLSLSKRLRTNPDLINKAKEVAEQEIGSHERRVGIDSLAPGMKLSRPLITFDGRVVLNDNLTLDEDLIWRIWQLAAIRPLNGPIVVLVD